MSNVDGIYNQPPAKENARIIHTFVPDDLNKITFGSKSESGTGGMESKVKSALWALDHGSSVVICNGLRYNNIRKIMDGQKVGTFFTKAVSDTIPVDILAKNGLILKLIFY
jgi:delta-1-pyrroline-5-carboxylate synthetase